MNMTNKRALILITALLTLSGCAHATTPAINQVQGNTTGSKSVTQTANALPPAAHSTNSSTPPTSGSSVKVAASLPVSNRSLPPLQAVDFVNAEVGYAGGKGAILKTTDGGQTWFQVFSGSDTVTRIDAYDTKHVWATTADNGLLASDNGQDWRKVDAPGALQGVDVTGPGLGYVVANGRLLHSTDDGAHFTANSHFTAVGSASFVTDQTGYIVTGNTVFKTVNGGESWATVYTAPVARSAEGHWESRIRATAQGVWLMLYGADHGMSQTAYVVFHSTDGGHTWSAVLDESYFSGDYPRVHPSLANSQWQMMQPGPFTTVADTPYFLGWNANQDDHLVLTTEDSNGWHFVRTGQLDNPDIPDFFSSPLDISFADERNGWIVGSKNGRGKILSSDDGGLSWRALR